MQHQTVAVESSADCVAGVAAAAATKACHVAFCPDWLLKLVLKGPRAPGKAAPGLGLPLGWSETRQAAGLVHAPAMRMMVMRHLCCWVGVQLQQRL